MPLLRQTLVLSLICFLLAGAVAMAGEGAKATAEDVPDCRIWTALVLATNTPTHRGGTPELTNISDKIERFFGYSQVQLIGAATKNIDEDCERWLVPSQNFWMSVKSKREDKKSYLIDLTLFHDKRRLVETNAKLAPDSPLFIRGPLHARGQLVIVLQVLP